MVVLRDLVLVTKLESPINIHSTTTSSNCLFLLLSRTPCCIQGLLDTYFPAYVGVELCESLVTCPSEALCECHSCAGPQPTVTANKITSCRRLSASGTQVGEPSSPNCQLSRSRNRHSSLDATSSNNSANSLSSSTVSSKRCGSKPSSAFSNSGNIGSASDTSISVSPVTQRRRTASLDDKKNRLTSNSAASDQLDNSCDTKCQECELLTTGGHAFLANIRKFFSHVHQYGIQEAKNRFRPNAPTYIRETCALNLPHIVR